MPTSRCDVCIENLRLAIVKYVDDFPALTNTIEGADVDGYAALLGLLTWFNTGQRPNGSPGESPIANAKRCTKSWALPHAGPRKKCLNYALPTYDVEG